MVGGPSTRLGSKKVGNITAVGLNIQECEIPERQNNRPSVRGTPAVPEFLSATQTNRADLVKQERDDMMFSPGSLAVRLEADLTVEEILIHL